MIGAPEKIEVESIGKINEINDRAGRWRAVLVVIIFVLVGVGFLFSEIVRIANVDADKDIREIVTGFVSWPKVASQEKESQKNSEVPHQTAPQLPRLIGSMPDPAQFGAAAVMIRDVDTGVVLFGKNQYETRPLASISKLMSALVILDLKPDWSATTSIVNADLSDSHLISGEVYTLRELWKAGLIASSNKAIVSLVHGLGVGQTDFVARMNARAHEMGMTATAFDEPTGLSENNVSSASDVILLISEALKHEEIVDTLLTKEVTLVSGDSAHKLLTTNWILLGWIQTDFDFLGGKTGFTNAAGYNFTMRVADKANHRVDVVVLGANAHEDRFTEAKSAAEWAFKNYVWPADAGYSSSTLSKK